MRFLVTCSLVMVTIMTKLSSSQDPNEVHIHLDDLAGDSNRMGDGPPEVTVDLNGEEIGSDANRAMVPQSVDFNGEDIAGRANRAMVPESVDLNGEEIANNANRAMVPDAPGSMDMGMGNGMRMGEEIQPLMNRRIAPSQGFGSYPDLFLPKSQNRGGPEANTSPACQACVKKDCESCATQCKRNPGLCCSCLQDSQCSVCSICECRFSSNPNPFVDGVTKGPGRPRPYTPRPRPYRPRPRPYRPRPPPQGCRNWGSWSRCSMPCGGPGTKTRTCRDVDNNEAVKSSCDEGPCRCRNWGSWSRCSVPCGGPGTKTRRCRDASNNEGVTRRCDEGPCGGTCTRWSVWSACCSTCGPGSKRRKCLEPFSQEHKTEDSDCNLGRCPDTCNRLSFPLG